jgi:hypothetical protein
MAASTSGCCSPPRSSARGICSPEFDTKRRFPAIRIERTQSNQQLTLTAKIFV